MEIKQHSLKCQMDQKGESQGILESILKWKQTNKQNIYIYNMLKLIRYTKAVLKGKFIPINAHI
jgi:hypothetical protein